MVEILPGDANNLAFDSNYYLGFSEIVLDDSGIAHTIGLEEVDVCLRILVYALFPLPLAFVFARRLVSGPRSGK